MLKIEYSRLSNKLYDILKEVLSSNTLDKYSKEFLEGLIFDDDNYVYIETQ
jgi:hypothetical protein